MPQAKPSRVQKFCSQKRPGQNINEASHIGLKLQTEIKIFKF